MFNVGERPGVKEVTILTPLTLNLTSTGGPRRVVIGHGIALVGGEGRRGFPKAVAPPPVPRPIGHGPGSALYTVRPSSHSPVQWQGSVPVDPTPPERPRFPPLVNSVSVRPDGLPSVPSPRTCCSPSWRCKRLRMTYVPRSKETWGKTKRHFPLSGLLGIPRDCNSH